MSAIDWDALNWSEGSLQPSLKSQQHTQRRQQAEFFVPPVPPTRIDAFLGCTHPPEEDWLRDTIEATFAHVDRIEIEQWSFPTEEPELKYDAEYYRDAAGDAASDADRDS